jgi:aristolochene synthase
MSIAAGSSYIERIISVVTGKSMPNKNVPAEWMMKEIWDEMRVNDRMLADDMIVPAIIFWRSQVTPDRLVTKSLRSYLAYREADIASKLAPPHSSSPTLNHD